MYQNVYILYLWQYNVNMKQNKHNLDHKLKGFSINVFVIYYQCNKHFKGSGIVCEDRKKQQQCCVLYHFSCLIHSYLLGHCLIYVPTTREYSFQRMNRTGKCQKPQEIRNFSFRYLLICKIETNGKEKSQNDEFWNIILLLLVAQIIKEMFCCH